MFRTNTPCFFKVILNNSLEDEKLSTPKKFAKRYRNDLSNKVTIQVPSGAVWDVELVKSRDDVWLQTGWKEFAEFYSIAYGYFLVFEYKRSCHFLVHIFDATTCEVDYPLTNGDKKPNLRSKESRNGQPEDTDSVKILEKFAPKRKAKEKWNSQCYPPSKKMNINSTGKFETTTKGLFPPIGAQSSGMKQENSSTDVKVQLKENEWEISLPGQRERSNKIAQNQLKKPLSNREKVDALSIVSNAFISNYPFFKIVMHPSHFRVVTIPASFMKNYLKQLGNALLQGSDGKTWPVYVKEYWGKNVICRGWKKFVKANDLVVGDVCVFELLMISEIAFRVTIFRASQMRHGRALCD